MNLLKDKYGITWWDLWDLKDSEGNYLRNIGSVYGNTVADYKQMENLLAGLKKTKWKTPYYWFVATWWI